MPIYATVAVAAKASSKCDVHFPTYQLILTCAMLHSPPGKLRIFTVSQICVAATYVNVGGQVS